MSATPKAQASAADLIGPGRLVLVTGPSGAGKDSVIAGARTRCTEEGWITFPLRIVTRCPTRHEEHIGISESGFDECLRVNSFALWWEAHGLRYAVPISIDGDIRCGRTVVCNTSRSMIERARARYRHVTSVLITAPDHVLASRLSSRRREKGEELERRLERNAIYQELSVDHVIDNSDALELAVDELVSILCTTVS